MSCTASCLVPLLSCLPVPQGQEPQAAAEQKAEVQWLHGPFDGALERARKERRPVFAYFWMEGSTHCADLYGRTLTDPAAATELAHFLCYSADVAQPEGTALVQRFGVTTLPTLLVVRPDGGVEDAIQGFIPLTPFLSELQRIRSGSLTVTALRAAADAAPDDLDKRYALAQKLAFVGAVAESERLNQSIRDADPHGETAAGADLLILAARDRVVAEAADASDPLTWDLAPIHRALSRVRHGPSRFQGWSWVANVEGQRGDRVRQRAAWQRAMAAAPPGGLMGWGAGVLETMWMQREELEARDRAFAFEMAKIVSQQAEAAAAAAAAAGNGGPPAGDEEEGFTPARALGAAARGFALARRPLKARDTAARALELDPGNEELVRIAEDLAK